ncbi:hypothetical protein SNE40_005887 [Patella caerulea]|uniref:H15 domain-containing protein n=1 Tax=Patella caerulea TaxID=87958 RepID=A0AAN8K907_PATCE
MPTLKLKKATADYIAEKEREKEREREKKEDTPVKQKSRTPKEKADGAGMLKGLDGEVLFEKRKRSIPPSEQVLFDWVDEHLTSKTGVHLSLQRLYEYYGDVCIRNAATILEFPHFSKICQDKVGKEFGFKDSSLLKSMINERPIQPKKPKVKGETLKLKLKDVIEEIFLELGNSRHGIRFPKLKQAVAAKYPALRVDLRPRLLRNALEKGVYMKQFSVVKGVGLAGYYRLNNKPSESEAEEERVAAERKAEEGKNGIENDDQKKKKVRRKKKDKVKKEGENGEGDGEDDKADIDKEGEKKEKAKKKKRRKSSKREYRPARSQALSHSDPQRIEDIFPLALTFGSEPKESTVPKMKKYISRYYHEVDIEKKLKPALEKGVELGIWDLLPGNKYVLKIGEFDPTLKKSMDDIICAAIIATTEPKLASAIVIKKYILEYHPNFDIENRPKLFTSALERACHKNILRQVSGIGATGSYLLTLPFTPSPSLLAGDEDEDDYEEYDADGYSDNYVAKPSKSRTNPLPSDVTYHKDRAPPKDRSAPGVSSPKKKEKLSVNRGVVKKVDKVKKGKKQKTAKPKIIEKPESDDEDVIEEPDEEVVTETVAKKSKVKTKKSSKGSRKAMPKAPPKAAPKSNKPRGKNKEEEESEPDVPQEEKSEDESPIKPVKSSKRSRNVPKTKGSSKSSERSSSRGRSITSYKEADSDVDQSNSEPDDEPVSKKSRRK